MARYFISASTQYLTNGNALITSVPFTFACWFNPSAAGVGTERGLMSVNVSGSADNVWLLGINTSNQILARVRTTTQAASTTTATVATGVWQHAAYVTSTNASRFAYLNGVAAVENTTSRTPAGMNQTYIGRNVSLGAGIDLMNGGMAEAGIWNIALTTPDILQLSKGASPILIRPANLVAYIPLWGYANPEQDWWKNKREFVLTGSPGKTEHPLIFMRG